MALLAAAGTLPMFLFCFFAGILADRFERRRYIIVCQFWMMGVAGVLAVLAFFGQLTAWNLLALSFCMGLGNAMNAPAWHAVVPEIVSGAAASAGDRPEFGRLQPRAHDRPGDRPDPARPGRRLPALRHQRGHLYRRHPRDAGLEAAGRGAAGQRREGFVEAARTGIAFVRGSAELKAIFARGLCFFVPGIAMGTLLPVIGRFELKLDEFTFGILYAVFGVGRGGRRHVDAHGQPAARRRSCQHLGNGHHRGGDAGGGAGDDAARRRHRGDPERCLLDDGDRQQRRLGADDPAQLHAGARHGGTPDGVFRRDGRGLDAVGQGRRPVERRRPR